jgi:hypothetical protein
MRFLTYFDKRAVNMLNVRLTIYFQNMFTYCNFLYCLNACILIPCYTKKYVKKLLTTILYYIY